MRTPPTSALVATGLLGGYSIARASGRRELGGLFLGACGVAAARQWNRIGGPGLAVRLGLTYGAAFGASHPLAKRIGAWPSVLAATAVASGAAAVLADRRA